MPPIFWFARNGDARAACFDLREVVGVRVCRSPSLPFFERRATLEVRFRGEARYRVVHRGSAEMARETFALLRDVWLEWEAERGAALAAEREAAVKLV